MAAWPPIAQHGQQRQHMARGFGVAFPRRQLAGQELPSQTQRAGKNSFGFHGDLLSCFSREQSLWRDATPKSNARASGPKVDQAVVAAAPNLLACQWLRGDEKRIGESAWWRGSVQQEVAVNSPNRIQAIRSVRHQRAEGRQGWTRKMSIPRLSLLDFSSDRTPLFGGEWARFRRRVTLWPGRPSTRSWWRKGSFSRVFWGTAGKLFLT